MTRDNASNLAYQLLRQNGLTDWKVRLTTQLQYLGKCHHDHKVIYLNTHQIDTHPDVEIEHTIRHEIAHSLVGAVHGHDEIWAAKARELGCSNTSLCGPALDSRAIDAIRSGHIVEVEYDEEIIRKPKYRITRLQDKCIECGKVAKEASHTIIGNTKAIRLECGHLILKELPKATPFEQMTSTDGDDSCQHDWNKNKCEHCGKFKLFPFQVIGAQTIESNFGRLGLFDEQGLGKGQILSDKILTPNGWKKFGELKMGDNVIGSDGNTYNVTAIFDRGKLPVWKVTFTDDSSITVDVEHLWQVSNANRRNRNQSSITKSTLDLLFDLKTGQDYPKWYVQIANPPKFSAKELPIEPYQIGVLLGDGSFAKSQISFTSIDEEIINSFEWKRKNEISYFLDNSYTKKIRELELEGRKSDDKFIPEIYRTSSIEQRLALLQGLMDTDGSIWNNGVIEYSTVSPYLTNGVKYLVESLGGVVKISSKRGKYTKNGKVHNCKTVFRIILNIPINPFRLKRKALQYKERVKYKPIRMIQSIESAGIEEVRCITVNSPDSLYVTNDFIVTHNTVQALAYLKYHPESFPVLFIVKSGIKYQWLSEIFRWLGDNYFAQVINSSKEHPIKGFKTYIVSYDLLRRYDTSLIKQLGIRTIVADECQAIKNPDSTRTQMVRGLVKEVTGFIPLSGTPWKNRGSEYFPVLNMLDPIRFPSNEKFINQWCDFYYDGSKTRMGGIRNVPAFREYTKDIIIRRERAEVAVEFPDLNRVKFHTALDETTREIYDQEVSDFVKWWNTVIIGGEEDNNKTEQNAIARLQRMRHMLGLSKIPATIELAEEFIENTDRKLVIFVHHKDVGEIINRKLRDNDVTKHVPIFRLTADMDSGQRYDMQQQFNRTSQCILVASTLASGEGLNLQTCSDCIIHERQWTPMAEEQVEGRFVRIGQEANKVNSTYVHAENSIDTHLDRIVERKRIAFHSSMNKGEMIQWNEKSMIGELISSLIESTKVKNVSYK